MRPRRPQEASKTRIALVPGGSWPPRGPKRPPRRPKRPPRGRQDGPRWPKTPPRRPKTAQVGFQNGVKVEEKSMEKSIENVMHLGIDFWKYFDGFLGEKWAKIEEKWMEKSIEKAMHLGVDFWKAKLFRSHEKSKKNQVISGLTAKRYVNESKVKGGFSMQSPP